MTRPHFQVNVSLPYDLRFAETLRLLVAHAAQYGGWQEATAAAFAQKAEDAVQDLMNSSPGENASRANVGIIVRQNRGPMEVVIGSRILKLDP